MLMKQTVLDFVNQVDSKSPAPGGGSVSALSALLGLSLIRMVAHVTSSKKSFLKLDPAVQSQMLEFLSTTEHQKIALTELVDKDTEAFDEVMKAYALPKNTEEEISIRNQAVQEATILATTVPYQTLIESFSCLAQVPFMLQYGGKALTSDLAVGIRLLDSAMNGAIYNIMINIPGIEDETKKQDFLIRTNEIKDEKNRLVAEFVSEVEAKLSQNL